MIYNLNGSEISVVYDSSGESLLQAYDVDGEALLSNPYPLKIMTYNVGQWYIGNSYRVPVANKNAYYSLQYETFENNPVNVLFLQEYLSTWCQDDSPASEFLSPFFDNIETTMLSGVYTGHAICTDGIAITDYAVHSFSTNRGNYPSFESATIRVGNRNITIINTHNDYVYSYQVDEVTELLAFLSNLSYFILAGDFNIDLSTEDTTDVQYQNSVKRFLDAGYHVGNCAVSWVPTYFGGAMPTGGKFTDQIITSSNIDIERIYAYTEKLTDNIGDKIDHLPLIAELTIK